MKTMNYPISYLRDQLRSVVLLLVAVFAAGTSLADDISAEQALQIANQFVKSPSTQQLSKRRAPARAVVPVLAYTQPSRVAAEKDNVYVVNIGNDQGFVVISGDTGVEDEVLGYCDHGSFDYKDCPVQLKDLLVYYAAAIDSLRQNPALASSRRRVVTSWPNYIGKVVVEPLLTTTWNQWGPYNQYCPEGCPSGCVPTAIAQVMNYWKWPKVSMGKVGNEDFSGHVYDWDNMLDDYDTYNSEQANAVARLMADIGKAFGTQYTPEASSTYMYPQALIANFGYQPGIEIENGVTAADLKQVMKKELDEKRPVLYSGAPGFEPTDIGHALVCDGYTDKDYFHFNYGWGGSYDGFYKNAMLSRYAFDAHVFTGVRPYEAVRKVIDGIEYGLLKSGTAEILDYTLGKGGSKNGELTLPSVVKDDDGNEYLVTRIVKESFYNKGHFSKLTLGDNIEVIDRYSFIYTDIDTLVLSDKMEVVPDEAFQTSHINSLTIGASVKRIGNKAFSVTGLKKVVSKSPAFEVGDMAFAMCMNIDTGGDWLDCITKLGRQVFTATRFNNKMVFKNLEEIGSQAFYNCIFPNHTFVIHSKVKSISPDAFDGTDIYFFQIQDNPNFYGTSDYPTFLCNSNGSSMVMSANKPPYTLGSESAPFPSNIVKLEPGSVRPGVSVIIPNTVVEMEGAFKECTKLYDLTCLAVVPPVISDSTFNDNALDGYPCLYVPKGCAELYANAPGWRRFTNIVDDQEYVPAPPQDRQYYMVVNSSDVDRRRVSIPVSEISSVEVSDDGLYMVIKRNGKSDLKTSLALVDSIYWSSGFVYENAEVFDMNDSTLTVKGQKCEVQFSSTCIDDDVQLCVRNAVLKPNVEDGITRGFAVDLTLSNNTHELSGTADIVIPVSPNEGEKLNAAYYNEEKGRWEPVCFKYDEAKGTVTITTNHLCLYSVYYTVDDASCLAKLDFYGIVPAIYQLNEATKNLLDIISSDDPEDKMIVQFKDDMMLWQSVGLDGLYNIATGISEPLLNFKPQALDNAVSAMGYLGTAMNILDVAAADIRGDDVGVAAGTLNTILNYAGGQMAAAIGTPIMAVSMGCVAFIGIALNKFGTMMQQQKLDMFRVAYRYYYSKEGYNECAPMSYLKDKPGSYYRTKKDWYDLFYPVFAEGKMSKTKLESFIEYAVRSYCDRYWDEGASSDVQNACNIYAKNLGWSNDPWISEAMKKQISEEYFAELMNGDMVEVITQIKHSLKVEADKRYHSALDKVAEIVNTKYMLKISDSSKPADGKSQFAGWKMRFSVIPSDVPNKEQWECTIKDDGTATLGYFTVYALLQNEIPFKVTLCDLKGVEQKTWSFKISEYTGNRVHKVDLATGGTAVEAPKLDDLQLTYEPGAVSLPLTLDGYYYYYDFDNNLVKYHYTPEPTGFYVRLDNSYNRQARFQYEIEKFFKRHDFITVDEFGHIKIGDDILGTMTGNEGTGKFTINTSHKFVEKTPEKFVQGFNKVFGNNDGWMGWLNLLNGTISHKIDCEFHLVRNEDETYTVTYTGTGTFKLDAENVMLIENIDYTALNARENQNITVDDITTGNTEAEGEVTLKYVVNLK